MLGRTIKNLAYAFSGVISSRVISGVASLFIAWALSVEGLGLYGIVISIATFANIVAILFRPFVVRDVAADKDNRREIISTIFFGTSLLALASAGALVFITDFFGKWIGVGKDMIILASVLAPLYLILQVNFQTFKQIFQGLQDFKKSSLLEALQSVFFLAIIVGLYFAGLLRVSTLLVGIILSFTAMDLLALFFLRNHIGMEFEFGWFKSRFKEGATLLPSTAVKRLKGSGLLLIVGAVTGSRVPVGYLKFVRSIVPMLGMAPNLLRQVLYPSLSELREFKGRLSDILNKFVRYSFTYQLIAVVVGILFFKEALVVLGLTKYSGAHAIFSLILVASLFGVPSKLNPQILFIKKRTRQVTIFSLIGYGAFFAVLPLIYWYGLVGVGLASVAGAVGSIYSFRYVSEEVDLKIPLRYIGRSVILLAVTVMEVLLLKLLLPSLTLKIIGCAGALLGTWALGYYYFILEKEDKKFILKTLRTIRGKANE